MLGGNLVSFAVTAHVKIDNKSLGDVVLFSGIQAHFPISFSYSMLISRHSRRPLENRCLMLIELKHRLVSHIFPRHWGQGKIIIPVPIIPQDRIG